MAASTREVRKVVTVVFSDLTGSTELGERLDLESLRTLLDRYFATMSQVLKRHGGSVEKFIGDAVMAVFGVPVLHEDDALRAVRAAVEMADAMTSLADEFATSWGVRPSVRIGVSTGEILAGDSAGRGRLATGDAVNVSARLEAAAQAGQVVISRDTYRLVSNAVDVETLSPLRLKGKSEQMPAYRVLRVSDRSEGLARRLDAPLVWRERDIAALRAVYGQVLAGHTLRRAVVVGMAGIGKSRLVAEFLALLGAQATVL
ncbi:MAG: hypothetical protein QOF53_2233, partial [Nocardioidaceae bacterium]|nr:hypothetical protein [Nocardioidaceae bacterium]